MGVYKTENKNGVVYGIDYRTPGGKRVRMIIGPNKRLAQAALSKALVAIAEGKYLDKLAEPQEVTLAEMGDKFLEWSKTNKRSWQRDELCLRHLLEHFGDVPLKEVSPFSIEGYKRKRVEDVSKRTVNIELACLRNLFNKALTWGDAASNPVRGVRLFPEPPGRLRYLSEDEIERLLNACSDHFHPLVLVALHTGMRRGEILNLRWQDINFDVGLVHVGDSKNRCSRDIPMSETVHEELRRLCEAATTEWVFTTVVGKTRRLRDIRSVWENTLKRADITDFRFHDLRHTAASYLVMNGVDLKTVQEILGHKTFAMTLRYAHLSPGHKTRAIRALDKAIPAGDGQKLVRNAKLLTLVDKHNI